MRRFGQGLASRGGLAALAVLTLVPWAIAQDETPRPVHDDPVAVNRGMAEAAQAFMRSDLPAARKGLDVIAAHTRVLGGEDAAAYGGSIVGFSDAFRQTLNTAREFSGAGEEKTAFEQFIWMYKACHTCHEGARKVGVMAGGEAPASGKKKMRVRTDR